MSDVPAPPAAATCFDCGYDLRGLPPEGRCPECGTPVAESRRRAAELAEHGDPAVLRRAVWVVLASLLALGLLYGLTIAFFALFFRSGPPNFAWLEWVLFVAGIVVTFCLSAGTWLACRLLRRNPPPEGKLSRRVLGVVGWVVPLGSVALWLVGVAEWLGIVDDGMAASLLARTLLLVVTVALMVFPMLYLGEVRRRVRFWPHWRWLPGALNVLRVALWVAAVVVAVPASVEMLGERIGYRPYYVGGQGIGAAYFTTQHPLRPFVETARVVGSVAYAAGILALLPALTLTLVGLRRLRSLRPASPVQEVGAERPPAATAATDES